MKFATLIALSCVAAVRLSGDDEPVDHSSEFFMASEDGVGMPGKVYERHLPIRFQSGAEEGDEGDLFMKSMITQYALEGKNKDGSPNGKFFLNENQARAAADEVVNTHAKLDGEGKKAYLDKYFPRTWAHFDVNGNGMVGVEVMPQFMRFVLSNQAVQYD